MSQSRKLNQLWIGCLLAGLAACHPAAPPAPQSAAPTAPSAAAQWPALRDRFIEDYFRANPFFAVRMGRHEFDGQMPDLSASGIQREIDRLHAARNEIAAVDGSALSSEQRFERDYALHTLDTRLFWIDKARAPLKNPYWYIDEIDPDVYLSRDYAPLDARMKAYIGYARAIPRVAADIGANLQAPMPKSYVELGVATFGGFADFFKNDVAPVFAAVKDPDLQKQLADADAAAAQAMAALKDRLAAQRRTATDQFAIGKEMFATMLADTERVTVPVEQIEAAGRADLDRNLSALKTECARYLPNGKLQACVDKMAANKSSDGAVEGARAQLVLLKDFIVKNQVVTVPGTEEARVAEAPPYNRGNFAFIQIPGPYDHGVASTYNISPPDPKWTKAERAAYIPGKSSLMIVSSHEVWPGHFLQFLHSNRNPSKIEALWVGYAFAEGWAHYCEEMMIEVGFGQGDPEMHVAQLQHALWRDVRLLSAIGLHTHGMTQAESERMFRERAYLDPGNARQQAARGTYDPAYLNYTLGKLMIRKLRADWVAKNLAGKAATLEEEHKLWHDFHDKFLSYGGPSIPRLRAEMLGEEDAVL